MKIRQSRSYLLFRQFVMFGMLLSFQYAENCRGSYILILHVLQDGASSVLLILILRLIRVKEYISDCLYCSNSQGNFKMTLELCAYQYHACELSLLSGVFCPAFSVRHFLSFNSFYENLTSYQSGTTTSTFTEA